MSAPNPLIDPLRDALAHGRSLRIQGHASKAFYGPPVHADACLDTRAHSGIVAYEPTELVLTARAGTPLVDIEAALAERAQALAFEPPHFGPAGAEGTLGGAIACGLSGPARASVGCARDFVLGLELIDGRAQVLRFGGQVMKNVAGYDVSRLMVGALGALGVISEVSIKVLPTPPARATLVFEVAQPRALDQLQRWLGQPLPLQASCWVRDDSAPGQPERLYVRLAGAQAAVESAARRLLADLPGQRLASDPVADWQACRDQRLPFFTQPPSPAHALWRLSVPGASPALALPGSPLIEWHGALRWLWAPPEAAASLRAACAAVSGSAMLFRATQASGTGDVARFDALPTGCDPVAQRLKAHFDPSGVFNPGRWASH